MPVYTNTSDGSLPFPGLGGVFASSATVTIERYVYPVPAGWELTSDDGAGTPCVTLFNGSIGETPVTGLAAYRQISITNGTNAVLLVHVNGDTTNTGGANLIALVSGENRILDNRPDAYGAHEYGSLSLSGAGTGSVVIVGFVNYAHGEVQ